MREAKQDRERESSQFRGHERLLSRGSRECKRANPCRCCLVQI